MNLQPLRNTDSIQALDEKQTKVAIAQALQTQDIDVLTNLYRYYKLARETKLKSVNAYVSDIKQFLTYAFTGDTLNLLRLTRKQAEAYKAYLLEHHSPSTAARKLSSVRGFVDYLRDFELVKRNEFEGVKVKQVKQAAKIRYYSKKELKTLTSVLEGDLKLIVLLGSLAGLRISETLHLDWQQVDLFNDKLVILDTKSGQPRVVQIASQLKTALTKLKKRSGYVVEGVRYRKAEKDDSDPYKTARTYIYNDLKTVCKTLDIQFKGTHGLRHASGIMTLEASQGNLQAVQQHLGHSSLQMAQHYAKADLTDTHSIVATLGF